jgi:folate-binding protein YgfZ
MKIFRPDPDQYQAARAGTVYVRLERGVLRGVGADRLDLLHRLSTNATRDLAPGDETSTILTSDKGRVVEVLRVIAFDDHILMILAGSDTNGVRAWLDKYTIMDDFTVSDVTGEYAVIGVYGDHAKSLLVDALGAELPDAGKAARVALGGGSVVIVRDARLTGAGGFLLLVSAAEAESIEKKLAERGARSIGVETYEALRIEAGIPEIGRELTESYNPLEAGLTQYISFTKGCYIGQEVIARLDTYDKVQRHLIGVELASLTERGGSEELEVRDPEEGKKIGGMTSAAYSPALGRTVGLAYVRTNYAVPGARVLVVADDENPAEASLTKLPFDR